MKKTSALLMAILLCLLLFGCGDKPTSQDQGKTDENTSQLDTNFRVETYFERHEDVPEQYKLDVRIPAVSPLVRNADKINDVIFTDFNEILNLPEGQFPESTGWEYPLLEIDYEVSNINGVCALNVISSLGSGYGSGLSSVLYSYYYDETSGDILQKDTYLQSLGYTEEYIADTFNKEMKASLGVDLEYSEIIWYFDQNNELQFITNFD